MGESVRMPFAVSSATAGLSWTFLAYAAVTEVDAHMDA